MGAQTAAIAGLVVMFIVATVLPINMGALAFALAFLVGTVFMGLRADQIIAGFPGDLFVTLVGITYLFAIALLACGLNSTVTATLAGQVVMEGFIHFRLSPVVRRLVTRGIAIVPALIVTWLYGESGTGQLLILSQVVLSLQLPFAMIPLMLFASDRKLMGNLVTPRWQRVVGWAITVLIVGLNVKLIADTVTG